MSTNTIQSARDGVTVNGLHIRIVDYTHDDYTTTHEVVVSADAGRRRMSIPTWITRDEAGARRAANAAWRAAMNGETDPIVVRNAGTAAVR